MGMNDKCIGIFDGNGESSKDFAQIAGNFFNQIYVISLVLTQYLDYRRELFAVMWCHPKFFQTF